MGDTKFNCDTSSVIKQTSSGFNVSFEYGTVIHGNEADWWKHSRETPRTEVRRVIKLHVEVKDNTSVLVQREVIQMALATEFCRSKVVKLA